MKEKKRETRHGKHRQDKRNTTFRLTESERSLAYEVARLEGFDNLADMFRSIVKEKWEGYQACKEKNDE